MYLKEIEAVRGAERERCAKIADSEADEYERRRVEFNDAKRYQNDADREIGWSIHAKRSCAQNIAALIRKPE
jgi:hypothetical protein